LTNTTFGASPRELYLYNLTAYLLWQCYV